MAVTLLLLCRMVASAHDFEVDGIYYNIISSSDLTVGVTYEDDLFEYEYRGEVVIPATVTYNSKTYSVTSIGNYAFNGCDGLTSITIPNSVTSIGNSAFNGCDGLTSITIPNNVTSIGNSAFNGCDGLTSITIPNSVTSIGNYAFSICSGLTSIDIPGSVTSIGVGAFSYCYGLTSITIPNSVTSIGGSAFKVCDALTSIIIENGNTVYDSRDNCNAIIETETNTLVVGCKNSTIPNSVTSIGNSAFNGCDGLTSITIPNSVTSIGVGAFNYCTGLTSITIGNGVTSIGNSAFNGCDGLSEIYSMAKTPATIDISTFSNYSSTLYVPVGAKEAYRAAGWQDFTNIVEIDFTDITEIATEGFGNGAIYDLQGRPINEPAKGNIYIIDGKKVVL